MAAIEVKASHVMRGDTIRHARGYHNIVHHVLNPNAETTVIVFAGRTDGADNSRIRTTPDAIVTVHRYGK